MRQGPESDIEFFDVPDPNRAVIATDVGATTVARADRRPIRERTEGERRIVLWHNPQSLEPSWANLSLLRLRGLGGIPLLCLVTDPGVGAIRHLGHHQQIVLAE